MKTQAEELNEFDLKQTKEREIKVTELDIQAALPPLPGLKWRVYVADRPLYGTRITVSPRVDETYSSSDTLSLEAALAVALALPATEEQMKAKGTFTSFLPATWYDEQTEEVINKNWGDEETRVEAMTVNVDSVAQMVNKLTWYTTINAERVKVEVQVAQGKGICQAHGRRRERLGGFSYEECELTVDPHMLTIFEGDTPMANANTPMKWGRGGSVYINRFTLHWQNLGHDGLLQPAVVIKQALEGLSK